MLHITNGDYAAEGIRALGLGGEVLPWRDVLHDGPVPAGLSLEELSAVRARFVSGNEWGDPAGVARDFAARDAALRDAGRHDEVVLWFEHDLYDQLQLVQVLDALGSETPRPARLTLVGPAEYLGEVPPERLAALFRERAPVTDAQLALASAAWAAFRAPDPTAVETFLAGGSSALPHLAPALRRHLEQFPGARDGLSRSERAALEEVAAGREIISEVYTASHHAREPVVFLGDLVFAGYLESLGSGDAPLLVFADDGAPVRAPRRGEDTRAFFARRVRLADAGRGVLEGREDRVALNGIDRWLGGVHLHGRHGVWRWNAEAGRLERR
jgi:hypothetical protein